MDSEARRYEQIVGALYEAALDDASLPAALRATASWLNATGVDMSVLSKKSGIVENYSTLDDTCIGEYIAYYYTVNPRLERAFRLPVGTIITDSVVMSPREIARSEFHQDYLNRYALGDCMGTILTDDASMWSYAALVYDRSQGAPDEQLISSYQRLAPHLNRLTRLRQALSSTRLQLDRLEGAVSTLALGILLLDDLGRVSYLNRVAEEIVNVGRGLSMRGGMLSDAAPARPGSLAAALDRARQSASHGGAAVTCTLARGASHVPLELTILRLPGPLRGDAFHFAVFLADTRSDPASLSHFLVQRFGLTGSETELALALMNGADLADIAVSRGVAITTVRSQLRSLFAKAGVRRQSELVATLWRASLAIRQLR